MEKNKNFIYVLEKALKVLEQFSSSRPNLTLTEIEQKTGYGPGTTHRILKTLTELGYLRFSDQTRRYSLTFKILNLGFSAISRMEVREIVRPELLSLAETTKQVVS
ncbi:MAG: helix-turn-helix domain-containing protein, partial [SAR324 cluster bacterium]|nr:helix-turn-helix domain-containing protein [SAR324 cluster bacterium]